MKNLFKKEHLLACSGLLFMLGGCSSDPLEMDNLEAAKTETTQLNERGAASHNEEAGSKRFLLLSETSLPSDLQAKVQAAGGTIVALMPEIGTAIVSSDASDFSTKAATIGGIRSVLPDLNLQWIPEEDDNDQLSVTTPPFSTNDDPLFNLQWGHTAVQAPQAWHAGYRGEGAVVAVLDTGFDTEHPDLKANILSGLSMSFVPGESVVWNPALRNGSRSSHGTHVAGTIAAADNGIGVIGVAPEAKLMLVKVLSDRGRGNISWIVNGIMYAADNGADIINMSLGGSLPRNGQFVNADGTINRYPANLIQEYLLLYKRAVNYATQKGTLVIAAAGNAGNNGQTDKSMVYIPSDVENVLSISATGPVGWGLNSSTDLDVLASYSNFGNKVDFAAPGGNHDLYYQKGLEPCNGPVIPGITCYAYDLVLSTGFGNYYWSAGTSMAAPHASGVAALVAGKHGGNISPKQLTAILKQSADDIFKAGRDPLSGHGRVNALRAVTQ